MIEASSLLTWDPPWYSRLDLGSQKISVGHISRYLLGLKPES